MHFKIIHIAYKHIVPEINAITYETHPTKSGNLKCPPDKTGSMQMGEQEDGPKYREECFVFAETSNRRFWAENKIIEIGYPKN